MTLPPGSRLGRYHVVELLGVGGMGMVYRARDERLQRDVAIKVLPPSVLADDTARQRFRKEALALAKLSHPNIATVFDVGEEGDTAYLVMECVPGEPLSVQMRRGPLPLAETLRLGVQIAEALTDAHDHGVIHRDLKPANVMITPRGQAKVLDFGLAKLLQPIDGSNATLSRSELGAPAGTPLYMSPEQAFGETVDGRTDLWSLGVVLYESLAGRPPFEGPTDWALLRAVAEQTPPSLTELNPGLPPDIEALITRAITKDPALRFQSAVEMRDALAETLQRISAPQLLSGVAPAPRGRQRIGLTVAAVLLTISVSAWWLVRSSHQRWAREQALPAAVQLADNDLSLAAAAVVARAERYAPSDTGLQHFAAANSKVISITSTPSGVPVAIQDYLSPDSSWRELGTTPVRSVTVPTGYFRWRLSPPGAAPVIVAPLTRGVMRFALDTMAQAAPGMVRVSPGTYRNYVAFIGWVGPYKLPAFDIDRTEVTNAQYQQFVDSGGYRDQKYWTEPFDDAGRPVTWSDAMARFRDSSGRSGPAGWVGGHFPAGQDSFPVAGVSWYEAAAYLAFRDKTLPSMAQWNVVAPELANSFVGRVSNMSHDHVAPVAQFKGVGPYGTYDMAGNVREWVYNANQAGQRMILGGSWSSPLYLYKEAEALPPFDRSLSNGIRGVRNLGTVPAEALQPIHTLHRDFAHFVPASDAVFAAYKVMYDYDHTPLDAYADTVVETTPDWKLVKVSYITGYGQQRMAAYLYLPTHVKPPYQAVVFSPSARVIGLRDSRHLGDVQFFDYVVQSGRAVVYPIYQNTYERAKDEAYSGASQALTLTVQRSKDFERTLDYLQTRPDIRHDDLAYMGVSMGAAQGAIFTTLGQSRLRTAVFLDGGYFLDPSPVGGDQADFVPRLKIPVLMVNGKYDETFSLDDAQNPMFAMLGTPAADKSHVLLEAAHDVTAERGILSRTVLNWLDKYMGRVE